MEKLLIVLSVAACPVGMAALAGGSWFVGKRMARRSVSRWRPATRVPMFGAPEDAREARQSFLIADFVGFTALTEAYGDDHAAELASRFRTGVQRLLPGYGASEVKALGDGVLLRVPDARDAVELAVRIVEEIGGREGVPLVRAGVHTGSAVERDGDWFGSAVNTAARVAPVAEGGEVVITEATRLATGSLEGIELADHGERRLKNLSRPVQLYRAARCRPQAEVEIPPEHEPHARPVAPLAIAGMR